MKMHPCSFAVPICLEEVLTLAPIILISIHTRQRGFSSIFARAVFFLVKQVGWTRREDRLSVLAVCHMGLGEDISHESRMCRNETYGELCIVVLWFGGIIWRRESGSHCGARSQALAVT